MKRRRGVALVLGEWVGLVCERIVRGYPKSRVPLLLAGHGWEEIKWANEGASVACRRFSKAIASPVLYTWPRLGRGVGFKILGLQKYFPVNIYAVLLLKQETAMTSTNENAGYAVVTPWVSCNDR